MAEGQSVFWRLMPSVRAPEQDRFLFFFRLSAVVTLAQTLGLAGSEALFLERVGPSALPLVFVLAPVATVLGCLAYAAIVGRVRNDLLFAGLLGAAAVVLGVGSVLAYLEVPGTLHAIFSAAYLTQAVLISLHYWTFAADFFDTLQSKRLYPYLVVGASAGGVLGGALAALSSALLPAETLVGVWALVLLYSAYYVTQNDGNLRRWRIVGIDEKDESSAAEMRGALRFVSRSPLVRWLVFSIVGMISALFVIQFIYMGIFSEAFDSAESLAMFLGVYLAVSNFVEILTGTIITPWLLRRLGVATANLVHPFLTLLVFPLLLLNPILISGVIARSVRELLENAMAAPIRQLSYNALPFRFRGRVRALLEGVVLFAAMATAGIALLLLGGSVDLPGLCLFGFGVGLCYLGASFRVRKEYLRSLVNQLQRGRLDLQELDVGLGANELASLAEQWESTLFAETEYPSSSLLDLAEELAERGLGEVVLRASKHPSPRVRITCIEALANHDPDRLVPDLANLLSDKQSEVRYSAVRVAIGLNPMPNAIESELRARLSDSDPHVRAYAALESGQLGNSVFCEMLNSADVTTIVAALDCLPAHLSEQAAHCHEHEESIVRARAVALRARLSASEPLVLSLLDGALHDDDAMVREAAVEALRECPRSEVGKPLALALDDSSRRVRTAASHSLSNFGAAGVVAALTQVHSSRLGTAEAALNVIASVDEIDVRPYLLDVYRDCVSDAWKFTAGLELSPTENTTAARFLQLAFRNACQRNIWLAFKTLALLEDPAVAKSVQRTLERGSSRDRADALEVLSNLGEREISDQFALLLESGRFQDKIAGAAEFLRTPKTFDAILASIRDHDDRWLKLAAQTQLPDPTRAPEEHVAPQSQEPPTQQSLAGQQEQETDLMQRLLALREVPLFSELSLDRLEAIHQLMHESQYLRGECVVREGDPGNNLYVLIEGELEIFKNHGTPDERLLSTLTPVGYMGEIAILDGSARSATAIASKDSQLLSLGGEPFKEVVLQTPEISFEIFKVLTSRVRAAEMRRE